MSDKKNYQKKNKGHSEKNFEVTRKRNNYSTNSTKNILLFPIIFIIAILPLIVRYRAYTTDFNKYLWFSNTGQYTDFFLYYKQLFLNISFFIMIAIIIWKTYQDKKKLRFTPIFIPLCLYALLSFFSSVFTEYRSYTFSYSYELFESIITILAYCTIVYYIYLFIETEQDIKLIIKALVISVLILSVIGIFQTIGYDIFTSDIGLKLILPSRIWDQINSFEPAFGKKYTYLTFYNPNYVGVYVSLIVPFIWVQVLFVKKLSSTILYILGLIGLIISLIGSKSSAGIIGLVAAILFSLIFFRRYILQYKKITVPILGITVIAVIILVISFGGRLTTKFQNALQSSKCNPNLTNIQTNDNAVIITYAGNNMKITYNVDASGSVLFQFLDNANNMLSAQNNADGSITITDNRFANFIISPYMLTDKIGFGITIDGIPWYFTNQTEDHTYYYYNDYGKLIKMHNAPSAVFTGYEKLFTMRGYIWSRTIPLLKDYIFLGSGPNTFSLVFPQDDYVAHKNAGFTTEIINKPHSLYLQTAIQTGLLSLIAFLIFYGWYFISSFRLYIKGELHNFYTQIGLGIFVGTIGYMISSITNDSYVTVAPVFWVFIGLGIVVNYKARAILKVVKESK